MNTDKPERDHDARDEHDNDNGGGQLAPAPTANALTSLAALTTALGNVKTTSTTGRSKMPMLRFKSREDGSWEFGQQCTVPEDGSRWALNPTTFMWGFVCFNDNNKVIGEHMVSVTQPKPDVTGLPDKGFDWQEQWTVNLKCLDGTDGGVEVIFKSTTYGGRAALEGLIDVVHDRLINGGQRDGKISPIVTLGRDSYPHDLHGRIWNPVFDITEWMTMGGPAPAPTAASPAPTAASPAPTLTPPPAEQPRRRRRVA